MNGSGEKSLILGKGLKYHGKWRMGMTRGPVSEPKKKVEQFLHL